jgi:hypothetical protein
MRLSRDPNPLYDPRAHTGHRRVLRNARAASLSASSDSQGCRDSPRVEEGLIMRTMDDRIKDEDSMAVMLWKITKYHGVGAFIVILCVIAFDYAEGARCRVRQFMGDW